jgi:eukaryotic-like serine/threonine-protein kinase
VTEQRPHKPTVDSEDAPRAPPMGTVLAGKYRVDGVVGAGGMGIVVAAEHIALGQTVAIKLLSVLGLDESRRAEACARFLREGQAAARLKSDHVVRVYDVGTLDDGTPFMVMELLSGNDLSAIISKKGPAPVEVAVEYIVQACDAVGEAHGFGIVHRDLKPSNLFVSRRSDGHPVVKVLDFGISKTMDSSEDPFQGSLTTTRSVVGSPYYMSPEQVRDAKRVDTRSDIWSLGMILYELLVGEPAFNAGTLPGICAAIAADAPEPVRKRRAEVPLELETVVMRCLEKESSRRYSTVVELVRALTPFLSQSAAASAEYSSRRLEGSESDAKLEAIGRFPADHPTIQSKPEDSGLRLSGPELDAPFASRPPGVSLEASPVGGTPGAALGASTLASAVGNVVVRDATLHSRTGTTLPAPTDVEPVGVVARAPTRDPGPLRRAGLFALLTVAVVAPLLLLRARTTPPATPKVELPLLHEPVGPSPPAPRVEALPPASPVLRGEASGAPPSPNLAPPPSAKPRGPSHVAKPAPRPPKLTPSPLPPDIRLER